MKKWSFLACSAVLALGLAACGDKEETTTETKEIKEDTFTPYTFTDMDGHEITINEPVEDVYIVNMTPLPAVYAAYKGSADGLVSVPADSLSIVEGTPFENVYPDLMEVPTNSELNVEEILAADPDVVFYTGGNDEAYKALTDAGLTAVAFSTAMTQDANAITNADEWVEQLAAVFNEEGNSKKILDYNKEAYDFIVEKTATVAEEDKETAVIIFALADGTMSVAGGGHYSDFWLTNSGAINAAAELQKIQPVDIEQLMEWNPDKIFLTNFNAKLPEDLYNNTISGFDFSQLDAVKNEQVYKIPLGSYRWYAPSNESALMLKWMASVNQPELFADMDIAKEISAFYTAVYGYDLTDAELDQMLNPTGKAAK
jgi:iron complex transport system substrate-binding protein